MPPPRPPLKFFMNTFGSQGDVEPFVALGTALRAAGHSVTLCTAVRFKAFVEGHGLTYGFSSDGILTLLNTDEGKGVIEGKESWYGSVLKMRKLVQDAGVLQMQAIDESWAACEACVPDVILYHPKAVGAPHFAQKLGVPAVLVALQPILVPTGEFGMMIAPSLPLGAWYNRSTYALLGLAALSTRPYVRRWRLSAGLAAEPPSSSALVQADGSELLVLHAHSPLVVPRPPDWPEWALCCGYWALPAPQHWRPPEALARFLAAGEPPVYVGFGSMTSRESAQTTRLILAALAAARVRGVIATGWGAAAWPEGAARGRVRTRARAARLALPAHGCGRAPRRRGHHRRRPARGQADGCLPLLCGPALLGPACARARCGQRADTAAAAHGGQARRGDRARDDRRADPAVRGRPRRAAARGGRCSCGRGHARGVCARRCGGGVASRLRSLRAWCEINYFLIRATRASSIRRSTASYCI